MKKSLVSLLLVLSLSMILASCNSGMTDNITPDDELKDEEQVLLLHQVKQDSFSSDSIIGRKITEVVQIDLELISDNKIRFNLNAPIITDLLIGFIESSDNFSDEDLENKIVALLTQTESEDFSFDLGYQVIDDQYAVAYTVEYMNVASCGLLGFYNHAVSELIMEMEENQK